MLILKDYSRINNADARKIRVDSVYNVDVLTSSNESIKEELFNKNILVDSKTYALDKPNAKQFSEDVRDYLETLDYLETFKIISKFTPSFFPSEDVEKVIITCPRTMRVEKLARDVKSEEIDLSIYFYSFFKKENEELLSEELFKVERTLNDLLKLRVNSRRSTFEAVSAEFDGDLFDREQYELNYILSSVINLTFVRTTE